MKFKRLICLIILSAVGTYFINQIGFNNHLIGFVLQLISVFGVWLSINPKMQIIPVFVLFIISMFYYHDHHTVWNLLYIPLTGIWFILLTLEVGSQGNFPQEPN